jgi:hypothetical protein
MPKVKSRKRLGKKLAQQLSPLFDPRTIKKPSNANVLPQTIQDTQNTLTSKYSTITCSPENTNPLNTKQELEDAAKLFAEFKQTYLDGDVGFIWIKDQTKDKYSKYRIVNGQLINRVVDNSKGIVKGVKQVYNIQYKKAGEVITQTGFLSDSSNFIIQVSDKRLRKSDLFNRFNKFKTVVLNASGSNQAVINKLIFDICGLLAPNTYQNNETALEMFNYRVRNIDGVVFETERGNRGGLITFIQRLVHMQASSLGLQVNFTPKSIFNGPSNNAFILDETLSQDVTGCKALQLSSDTSVNFQNSLRCGLWLQISLPSVPHLVTVIVKNGQIFTFGGGYNEPMVAIPSLTFEFGTMWVYSPDDLIFDTTDVENKQVLVKWGFYNEDIQAKLNKMLAELNQLYATDSKSYVANLGRSTKYYRIKGYYSSLSNRIFNMFGLSNCSVLGHSVVGGPSNVCMLFDAPWDMKKFGFMPNQLDDLFNFVTRDPTAAPAVSASAASRMVSSIGRTLNPQGRRVSARLNPSRGGKGRRKRKTRRNRKSNGKRKYKKRKSKKTRRKRR